MSVRKKGLPKEFPFRKVFLDFLEEYTNSTTYWYIPKTRTLSDENAHLLKDILTQFSEFSDEPWNPATQDKILNSLKTKKILAPYKDESTLLDRTALTRIWKKMLETLGLLWVHENQEIVLTTAGSKIINAKNPRKILENQIAKFQFPNPTVTGPYRDDFKGILPHLFLLQVLKECDFKVSEDEYELFVNLAQSQDDLRRIVNYIRHWRDLTEDEKQKVMGIAKQLPMHYKSGQSKLPFEEDEDGDTRHRRIRLDSSYQRSFFTYSSYLSVQADVDGTHIVCKNPDQVEKILKSELINLKILSFLTLEDWFAYYGDPDKKPSWFTYLISEVEKAPSEKEAKKIVEKHKEKLTESEKAEIFRKQIEKKIEDFFVDSLELLEPGLKLFEKGRQYVTPIGRIDLLCKSKTDELVIVEIKANEADDSVFGQILRYIGWIHRNLRTEKNSVRGIILASEFPETARYSRIGLLKKDYKDFLKFKKHGLNLSDS